MSALIKTKLLFVIRQRFLLPLATTLLAVSTFSLVNGQVLMTDKAYSLLQEGQLEKSRQAIDIASKHPSTARDAKTWYLRGFIYKDLASALSSQSDSLRKTSIQSALKCIEVDSLDQFTEDCQKIINFNYTSLLNEAIAALNNQKPGVVLNSLDPVLSSEDSFALTYLPEASFYYGYASLMEGNRQVAREYFIQALQYGYQDPLIFEIEADYRMSNAQWDSAAWYLNRGRQLFPDDPNLQIAELNLLMQQESYAEAENRVVQYLSQHPNDIEGLLLAGTIYEKLLEQTNKSESIFQNQILTYEQILELDSNHIQANYNLGIAYYNRAVKLINGAANSYDLDIVAFNQLLEQCSALFMKALPYIQKVSSLDNDHINALKALEGIYYNINDYEQYNLIKAKLQKL